MIDIDEKEILQINASIMAGALIFLTISSFASEESLLKRTGTYYSTGFGLSILISTIRK